MPGLNSIVSGSFALLGYLENEAFSAKVEKLLKQSRQGKIQIYLHAINLGEVYYITLRKQGQDLADLAIARIKAFPVQYIDIIEDEMLRIAARLKTIYPISYADAFAAALAVIKHSSLLTGDPEFGKLEKKEDISIEWLT